MFLQGFKAAKLLIAGLLLAFNLPTPAFSQQVATPPVGAGVSFGFVIDNSGSFRKLLEDVIGFVGTINDSVEPVDEAFFVRFIGPDKIKLEQEFTSSKSEIRDATEAMYIEAGQTALIDAVRTSAEYLTENARKGEGRTRALIVVSDGDERASVSKLDETIQLLKQGNIRVFAVAVSDEKVQAKVLERLARESGGRLFVLKSRTELRVTAVEVAAALRKP